MLLPFVVIDCGDPGTPNNGNTIRISTTFGSVVNHTCNVGFVLNGANQRECLESGNWSEPLPSCEGKYRYHSCAFNIFNISVSDCGDPGRPENGNTIGDTFTVGSIVNHTCNEGFVLIGTRQRECLGNRSWSESLPTCNSKFTKSAITFITIS